MAYESKFSRYIPKSLKLPGLLNDRMREGGRTRQVSIVNQVHVHTVTAVTACIHNRARIPSTRVLFHHVVLFIVVISQNLAGT